MSRTIRLLICDIDGTLVRHDKTLSDGVVAAIGRARDAGLAVSLISARPPAGMLWIAERLGLTSPIGAFNGGTIVKPDGTIVDAEHIERTAAARVLAAFDRPGINRWLFADGNWYATTLDDAHVDRERRAANLEPVVRADFGDLADRADKIVAVSEDHAALAALNRSLGDELKGAATVAQSQPYYLDVTAPDGNKGAGVTTLAKAFGVLLSETAVIGDQYNDLPMFAVAGYSVAMGQAPDAVKAAADAVAASNDEDGVADAIDRLILPAMANA